MKGVQNVKIVTFENLKQFTFLMKSYINRPDNELQINNEWLKITYPVGSIYISTSGISPSELFGFGTWEQIKDVFLLTAGDTYQAGSVGGEATHALTINEMPSHTHTYKRHTFNKNDTAPDTGEDAYGSSNKTLDAREGATGTSGDSQPHNNMPPYLTVYAWQRID